MMPGLERQGESGAGTVPPANFRAPTRGDVRFPRLFGFLARGARFLMKPALIILGVLSALLIVIQMVMGLLIRSGQAWAWLRTAHFHSGSLMVLLTLAYIALSLSAILSRPEPK
jgi:hypothetical protein